MKPDNTKNLILWITIGATLLIMAVFFMVNSTNKTSETAAPEDYELGSQSVAVAEARLASANNALDGTGDFNEDLCESLANLALDFDSSSDFVDCASPRLLYLDTPDTSNSYILTVSDETYTSKFTTDTDLNILINYEFINEASRGFNNFGGRR